MRLHRTETIVAALVLGLWALPALAQPVANREATFREWDRNRDHQLSESEFRGHEGNFRAMDCNRDGVLSMDEFVNRYECGGRAPAAARTDDRVRLNDEFGRLDRNDDGILERREWSGAAGEFRTLDDNGDGLVSRQEWADRSRDERAGDRREVRFDQLDRNGDGVLSRWEFRGEPIRFYDADRNRDQVVSRDEYVSAMSGARSGWVWPDERRMQQLDRDGDGGLSRWELSNDAAFNMLDRNGDDWISQSEIRNRSALADRFRELDRDGNGYVSEWEWRGGPEFFARLDTNRDGRVSRFEFLSFSDGRSYVSR